MIQIYEKIDSISGKTSLNQAQLETDGLKVFNEALTSEIQQYESCKASVANLIKQIKILEKEKVEAKKSFVSKMEVFEQKWVEVTKTIKVISSVQKETNKLWTINRQLKETLNKDVETLNGQVNQLVSSQQANQSLSQVNTEIDNLATLRQKVEKTKDLLTKNSIAIHSAISKVTSSLVESKSFVQEVSALIF